jgi:hypothetical protein
MARDVTPLLGTALDRLNHPAQRIVKVVAEHKQFGTLAASGRGPPPPGISTLIKML